MELFKEDGRREGEENTLVNSVRKLMINMNWTMEQAMDALIILKEQPYEKIVQKVKTCFEMLAKLTSNFQDRHVKVDLLYQLYNQEE